MVYSLQSPEFVQAFRIVTESLLSALQNGKLVIPSNEVTNAEVMRSAITDTEQPMSSDGLSNASVDCKCEVRYAACPTRQGDWYIFKNLKDEIQEGSTYKIYRYDDGACEFELCDLKGEFRQIFMDNKDNWMPAAVGESTGEITAEGQIRNIRRGKGRTDGRSVRITAPMYVEFS